MNCEYFVWGLAYRIHVRVDTTANEAIKLVLLVFSRDQKGRRVRASGGDGKL